MATDIRGPWHDEVRVTLTSLGATALQDDDREAVRRVIEALRLGKSFDLYRQAVEDGSEAVQVLAVSIADAFVEAAAWEDELPAEWTDANDAELVTITDRRAIPPFVDDNPAKFDIRRDRRAVRRLSPPLRAAWSLRRVRRPRGRGLSRHGSRLPVPRMDQRNGALDSATPFLCYR